MFERILYPTDFSDVAAKALTYIKKLKDSGVREVLVLHVLDERGYEAAHRFFGEEQFEALQKSKRDEAERLLQGIAQELKKAGLKVTLRLESGIPVREILKAEAEESVSATVIGSHGLSNLQEMFLGSVSEKVVRKSKKPVLVIKR
jgi:nucleotide-binding universal stress UspA family protein